MKTYTIKEILESEVGMIIPRVEAKLQKVWDRKTGEGEHGPWSLQNGELADGTGSIKVCFSGLPNISEKQGENLVFRAQSGKKGLSGIKVDENTYKGVTSLQLKITKSAIIVGADEVPDEIPMSYPSDAPKSIESIAGSMMGETLQKNAPKANVATKKATDGVSVVKHRLMQMANYRALCDSTVEYLYGEGASDEMKKDVSSCFFIQGMREGLEKQLPSNKPISKKEEAGASENLEEKEDEIF